MICGPLSETLNPVAPCLKYCLKRLLETKKNDHFETVFELFKFRPKSQVKIKKKAIILKSLKFLFLSQKSST